MIKQARKYIRNQNDAQSIFQDGFDKGSKLTKKLIIKLLKKEREHHRHSGLAINIFNSLIDLIEEANV
jgi:hypothetical protein